jgi:hypothetical protein
MIRRFGFTSRFDISHYCVFHIMHGPWYVYDNLNYDMICHDMSCHSLSFSSHLVSVILLAADTLGLLKVQRFQRRRVQASC